MLPHIAVALTVFALGWGCQVEPEPDPLDAPRHERCTAMLECAQDECMTEIEDVQECYLLEPNCSQEVIVEHKRDRTACLDTHGCNFTRCTVLAVGWEFECEDDAEEEILRAVVSDSPGYDAADAADACAML